MASGGRRWNSRLPQKGQGRVPGPQGPGGKNADGKLQGGIRGGQKYRNGEVRGKHKMSEPEKNFGGSLLELETGAREIRGLLLEARRRDDLDAMVDKAFEKAKEGEFRYYADIMDRIGGKAMVTQTNIMADLTGDEVAAMAEQVEEKFAEDREQFEEQSA